MALAQMRPEEIRQLTQYDQFTGIWREIDDGRLEALRNHSDLQVYVNDKQKGVTPLFLVRPKRTLKIWPGADRFKKPFSWLEPHSNRYDRGKFWFCFLQAIKRKEVTMVLLLLANGADPNIPCKDTTPLWLACFHGLTELVFPLLDNGADANVLCTGTSPLHVAAARGLVEVVHLLCGFPRGADVNLSSERLGTALHVSVTRGHQYVLEALLQYSPNLNVQNRHGETIFHLACSLDDDDMVNKLLNSKLDIDPFLCESRRGATAAHFVQSVPIFRKVIQRWPNLFYALDRFERTPSFYIACNIVALLTSLTSKAIKQNGEALHSDIPRYADIALVCPTISPKVLQAKEDKSAKASNADSNKDSAAGAEETKDEVAEKETASATAAAVSCEKVEVLAHKAMLYARLPYFAKLLSPQIKKGEIAPAVSPIERLEVPEYTANTMRAVIHYVYTDELKCPKGFLRELVEAARAFGVKRLADLARARLTEAVEADPTTYPADMAKLLESEAFADVLVELPPVVASKAQNAPSSSSASPSSSTPSGSSTASSAPSKKYRLHRFILSTFSEYFRTMFSAGMRESSSGHVELEATPALIFEAYAFWSYTSTLKPSLKTIKDAFRLLELAHAFMDTELSLPIQTKILVQLSNDDWFGLETVFPEADRLGAQIVAEQCALRFASLREAHKRRMAPDVLARLERLSMPIVDTEGAAVRVKRQAHHD